MRVVFVIVLVGSLAGAQTAVPAASATPAAAPVTAPPTVSSTAPQAATTAGGEITGAIKAGTVPLPGVAITAANTLTGQKVITSTDTSGAYTLAVPSNGRWVIKAE